MTFLLALALLHIIGAIVWAASAAVLGLILAAARRDDDAAMRALPETAALSRRVLRPAILVTTLSGLVLALAGGLLTEAWLILSTLLAAAALAADAMVIGPECRQAQEMPRGAALVRGRHALGLAGISLGAQAGAMALTVLAPGWSGAAILAGLVACLVLAVALEHDAETAGSIHA
ncbi:hypothetical protein Rumeso_03620 [Rubellimicrobium mesophilum DSM 19309]|uniref:DUF2269 family protein n=1 Tax=Rubellimicrobium mesophilum DSM 19309 TaxID=442562 RepID=A0A017HKV9_9RHOB|nr:DUF2269 family protein [Rubellimicrobium mesophilum]EYD74808.1 hypothetical protein Rumeso_03620 [Rubellimicrobium mesophilum DSM 19309]